MRRIALISCIGLIAVMLPTMAVAQRSGSVVVPTAEFSCEQATFDLTLAWDGIGQDWELHLIRPGGRINDDASDCTWTSCIHASPDWGVQGELRDNPRKDADITGSNGPERICLSGPEPGVYTILVEHWSASGSPLSDGNVRFRVSGVESVSEVTDLPPHHVWTAGTIEWPSGVVTVGTDVVDCSASWSGGCQMALP